MSAPPIVRLMALVEQGLYPSVRDATADFVQYALRRDAVGANFEQAAALLQACQSADLEPEGRLNDWFREFLETTEVAYEFRSFLRFRDFPATSFASL